MRRFLFFALLLLLSGCRSFRDSIHQSDDSIVIVRTEIRERIDTAYIEIERESMMVMLLDTVSRIENQFAISEAKITNAGFLIHSLETKPQTIPVGVAAKEIVRDSIVYRYRERKVEVPVEVEVEKSLSNWQRVQIYGFWCLAIIAMLLLIWKLRRPVRNYVLRMMQK